MDRLLGIIRENGTLTARVSRRQVAPDFESREATAQVASEDWYEIASLPLETLEPALFLDKAPLLAAWERLGCVSGRNAETLAALRLVLAETVLGTPSSQALPPLVCERASSEKRRKPTAAHPRAYQGTKHKPPTEKSPEPTDLRPFLCGVQRLGWLMDEEEARQAAESRLPELFRTTLYPKVRDSGDADRAEALALYWALALEEHPARLAAVAALFCESLFCECGSDSLNWGRFVSEQPDEWRTPLLHLLLASGAFVVKAEALPPLFTEHLAEVFGGGDPLYRAYWLLHGLTTGIAPEYLLAGYRLEDKYTTRKDHPFHRIRRSGYFPMTAVERLWEHLASADDFYAGYALHLWECCGLRAGLGEVVEDLPWQDYSPTVAYKYILLYVNLYWDDLTLEQQEAKWQFVRRQVSTIEELMRSVPSDHQRKCLWHLIEYLWQWDTPEELNAHLPSAYALTRRLCQPPFDKNSDPSEVLTDFLAELPAALCERFLNAPDTSFKRLEDACRRENNTQLIGCGTVTLTQLLPSFSVRCFESYPTLLFKVAKLLGSLPGPVRDATLAPFVAVPLFIQDLAALPLADAAALVDAYHDPAVFHPIPPKLREHLAGTRTLTPIALAQAVALMGKQTLRTGLELLQHAILHTLESRFGVDARQEIVKHTLQIERLSGENRRALRKFLRAYWDGQTDYRRDHPRTRRWLAAHPRLDLNIWLAGIPYQATSDAFGLVALAIETDPLEALKLGTYVGSCLGLGGAFTYSAAAVVLDINKQVVYARDSLGVVLARQLVAISEDDQLVCYWVYPLSTKPEMETLFADYDKRLSQALGLPLFDANSDDYEIAPILSHDWWDDSAWDFQSHAMNRT